MRRLADRADGGSRSCGRAARRLRLARVAQTQIDVDADEPAPRRPPARRPKRTDPAYVALGLPPVHPGPLPGYLLIADRNNNRTLIVSPAGRIVWSYRGPARPRRRLLHARLALDHHQRGVQRHPHRARPAHGKRVVWTLRPRGRPRLLARLPEHARRRLQAPERRRHRRRHPQLPDRRALAPRPGRPRHRRQLRPRPALAGSRARTATRRSPTAGCSSPRSAAGSTGSTGAAASSGRCARRSRYPSDAQLLPERADPRLVVHLPGPDRRADARRQGHLVVRRRPSGPDLLDKPSLAVQLPERADRRQRRLRRPRDPDRPADQADRLAVRPHRRRLVGPRVPVEARRDSSSCRPRSCRRRRRRRAPRPRPVCASPRSGTCPRRPRASPPSRSAAAGCSSSAASSAARRRPRSSAARRTGLRRIGTLPTADPRRRGGRPRHDRLPPRRRAGELERRRRPHLAVRQRARTRARSASRSPTSAPPSSAARPTSRAATPARSTRPASSPSTAATPTLAARLPVGLRYAGVAALDGQIYVAGGVTTERHELGRLPLRPGDRRRRAGGDPAAARWRTRRSSRSAAPCT